MTSDCGRCPPLWTSSARGQLYGGRLCLTDPGVPPKSMDYKAISVAKMPWRANVIRKEALNKIASKRSSKQTLGGFLVAGGVRLPFGDESGRGPNQQLRSGP